MHQDTEVAVTLTAELFDRLRVEAERLGVAFEWVVAALVADTMDSENPAVAGGLI